jgi:hypothetical protein
MGKPWRMLTVMVVNERAPGARSGGSVPGAVHARCVCADTELPNYGLKKLATG